MKYGCCMGFGSYVPPAIRNQGKLKPESYEESVDWLLKHISFLKSVGYDFVEFPVGMVVGASENEFAYLAGRLKQAELKPEAFNCFIPGSIKLVGNDVDINAIRSYLDLAIYRTSLCGAKVIVFGSGAARNVPDGYPVYKAESQINDFLNMAAECAAFREITIAIEPLNRRECNIINLVGDAIELATDLGKPEVKVLADFYHMDEEKESFDSIIDAGYLLAHVHLADTGRLNPGSGNYDYAGFFDALKQIEYNGRVSLECGYKDYDNDVKFSLNFLKGIWRNAN